VADRYGSKKGLLRTHWHRLLYFLGFYRKYQAIDWSNAHRLVFICKGNICRSAFAEAVARSRGGVAESYGIDTVDAAPANPTAIVIASEKGLDLSQHRTSKLDSYCYQQGDVLLAMEPWQADAVAASLGPERPVTLLGLWGDNITPHIEDPFNSSPEYFHRCFDLIFEIVTQLDARQKNAHKR
jgi:protein-tyrosine phosphatase